MGKLLKASSALDLDPTMPSVQNVMCFKIRAYQFGCKVLQKYTVILVLYF